MKVKNWKTEAVTPYENNARNITEKAINIVATSLQEFGWQQPIVVDIEGVIIAGHTRWMAACKLGYKQVPVVTADKLTPQQVKAYRLADNRTGQEATWDYDKLAIEIGEFDLDLGDLSELTAFSIPEIKNISLRLDDEEDEEKIESNLKSFTVKMSEKEIVEIKSWLETIVEGHPGEALLRVARWYSVHGLKVD